jgi:hypothetical protein
LFLRCPDGSIAIDEYTSTVGLLPDIDELDLGMDREERGERLGHGDLVEVELDTEGLLPRLAEASLKKR